MQLPHQLEHLVARIAVEDVVEEVPDEHNHRAPLLLRHRRPFGRIALIVRILQHRVLPLVEVQRALLALVHLEDLTHPLVGRFGTEEEPAAVLEHRAEVVDVGAREVLEEGFEDVEDDVHRRDFELGQLRDEAEVLRRSGSAQSGGGVGGQRRTFDLVSARSTFRFFCKYRNSSSSTATSSFPTSGMYGLSVPTRRE